MHPDFLGDSYDLVKRFFCRELATLGYKVVVDPKFTTSLTKKQEENFLRLIGASSSSVLTKARPRALFLDPDTGVGMKDGKKHVSFSQIALAAETYDLVLSFDQSFVRQDKTKVPISMDKKFAELHALGRYAMYYDSHARFLFVSRRRRVLNELRGHLVQLGLPAKRLRASGT